MKRSLLLISLLGIVSFTVVGQEKVNSVAKPKGTNAARGPQQGSKAKSSSPGTATKPVKKRRKTRVITHTAPDQARIDSIKNEKMKHKK